jgi:hypothetical protein
MFWVEQDSVVFNSGEGSSTLKGQITDGQGNWTPQ